ncbi:DUF1749-domain-containing protein, partial [Rozella allomycis CSF55]
FVVLGGLTDGFLSLPYVHSLKERFRDFSVVQPLISSSYLMYGTSSLDQDADDMHDLLKHLIVNGKKEIFVIGHSTGANIMIKYCQRQNSINELKGVILQGAVSDRAYNQLSIPQFEELKQLALKLCDEGKDEELLPRSSDIAPMSARRFLSFNTFGGDDDMFSFHDLDKNILDSIYFNIKVPLVLVLSGQDEYVPKTIDQNVNILKALNYPCFRMAKLLSRSDHAISDLNSQEEFNVLIEEFIK